jgi:mannose-6-phosphate isomerase-like protein (cupin superfamily)
MNAVQQVVHEGELIAVIVPADFHAPGIQFFTPDSFSQQLAYMQHPVGKQIEPHVHNPVPRAVNHTLEVLFVRRGRVRVDLYSRAQAYLESRELHGGDVILLASGGHGFEFLEETEMIEVKQGPYAGTLDKTRFTGVPSEQTHTTKP